MLTLQDCVDYCDIDEDEILAIAEHEHVPEIIAAEIAQYVVHSSNGTKMIRKVILEDIEMAKARGDTEHATKLEQVLKHFVSTHSKFSDDEIRSQRYRKTG